MNGRPDRTEATEYYFGFIDQVVGEDICAVLEVQAAETLALLEAIPESQSLHRSAPGKWSIRQVVGHINDTEPAWTRRGVASDNPFTVRALAFLAAGHVVHHMGILRERYL